MNTNELLAMIRNAASSVGELDTAIVDDSANVVPDDLHELVDNIAGLLDTLADTVDPRLKIASSFVLAEIRKLYL